LLALRADITCTAGAYSGYPWTAGIEPLLAGGLLSGPYRLANYDCTVRGVATNTAPAGPYRGVARPAFADCHGLQCGFCTPGFLISALHLLTENPDPSREEIRAGLSGNICRCTGYVGIVDAVRQAAIAMRS